MKNLNQFLRLVVSVLAMLFVSAFISSAMGKQEAFLPMFGSLLVLGLVPRTRDESIAFDAVSPDVTSITQYVRKYEKKLTRRLLTGIQIFKDITGVYNVKDSITLTRLDVNGTARPYDGVFSPTADDLKYTPRKLQVDDWQRDLRVEPKAYRTTYLAEERGPGENAKNDRIPFAQFTSEAIIDANASDLNNVTAFNGLGKDGFTAFDAGDTYAVGDYIAYNNGTIIRYYKVVTATNAGETPVSHPAKFANADLLAITEGLGTKIFAGRTAGDIGAVTTTGSLATDAYEKFTAVWRKWPEPYRTKGGLMYCSLNSYQNLLDDIETNVSKFTTADLSLKVLPKTEGKCVLMPVSWMSGSEALICTRKSNLLAGTNLLNDMNMIKIIQEMYHFQMGITAVLGFNYRDGYEISMNDMN